MHRLDGAREGAAPERQSAVRRLAVPGLALAATCLLLAGCGARPQQAVGVSRGPVVHYLLCSGDLVDTVRLTAPDGRVLWEIRSAKGSTRTDYRVGQTPPGFTQAVAFHGLAPTTRVSGPAGRATMSFARGSLPQDGILRGDGKRLSASAFQGYGTDYCGSTLQDRAGAYAIGFAFLVLAAFFLQGWLRRRLRPRSERMRDPWSRHRKGR